MNLKKGFNEAGKRLLGAMDALTGGSLPRLQHEAIESLEGIIEAQKEATACSDETIRNLRGLLALGKRLNILHKERIGYLGERLKQSAAREEKLLRQTLATNNDTRLAAAARKFFVEGKGSFKEMKELAKE